MSDGNSDRRPNRTDYPKGARNTNFIGNPDCPVDTDLKLYVGFPSIFPKNPRTMADFLPPIHPTLPKAHPFGVVEVEYSRTGRTAAKLPAKSPAQPTR